MYSDEWIQKGYKFESRILIAKPVYYRHVYDKNDKLVGVIVDFECIDDFHYELFAEDWKKFCEKYLGIKDEKVEKEGMIEKWWQKKFPKPQNNDAERLAFQQFIESNESLFAFQYALSESNIRYDKVAYF